VQIYLHPEAKQYKFEYGYGKDTWRKYVKLYSQNIARIEEFENNKKRLVNL
jgi:hypothetical protein